MWNLLHVLVEQSASGSQDMASEGGLQWGIASQALHCKWQKKTDEEFLTKVFLFRQFELRMIKLGREMFWKYCASELTHNYIDHGAGCFIYPANIC